MRGPVTVAIVLSALGALAYAAGQVTTPATEVLMSPGGNGCAIIVKRAEKKPLFYNRACRDVARYLREELQLADGSGVRLLVDRQVEAERVAALTSELVGQGYVPSSIPIAMQGPGDMNAVASTSPEEKRRAPGPGPEFDRGIVRTPPELDRSMAIPPPDMGRDGVIEPPVLGR